MKRKPVILWVGDGGVATGFARVNHSIIDNLPEDKYDVHHLAINYRGDPYSCKSKLYPALLGGDLYGFGRLAPLIDQISPDLIFILNDPWLIPEYLSKIPDVYLKKVVCYFPVDAKPLHKDWAKAITDLSIPVAYTEYGKSAILEHCPDAEVKIIPHGIDTTTFYPMPMWETRRRLAGLKKHDFIILNANRNQPRKRVDLTLKGFAAFAKGKPPNVKLYMHMGVEDMGWHVLRLAERLGIDSRIILTSLELSPARFVSDERLNWIYNSCDVGINNSMGEGWGLTSFEHGACARAQIVPDSSACKELYTDNWALRLPIDHYETYPKILTEGAVVTLDGITDAMETYYSNPELRQEHAQKLYEFITSPRFDWKRIASKWDEVFEGML